jgi:hypothetical protein
MRVKKAARGGGGHEASRPRPEVTQHSSPNEVIFHDANRQSNWTSAPKTGPLQLRASGPLPITERTHIDEKATLTPARDLARLRMRSRPRPNQQLCLRFHRGPRLISDDYFDSPIEPATPSLSGPCAARPSCGKPRANRAMLARRVARSAENLDRWKNGGHLGRAVGPGRDCATVLHDIFSV